YRMDEIVSAAIQKGQHLKHIIASNEMSAYRASIYRYLEKGYLSTKPIDFPRVVKYRKRRIRNLQHKPKIDKEGRSY
ncbi:IS30 family transposase, partial [Streptococcus suis]